MIIAIINVGMLVWFGYCLAVEAWRYAVRVLDADGDGKVTKGEVSTRRGAGPPGAGGCSGLLAAGGGLLGAAGAMILAAGGLGGCWRLGAGGCLGLQPPARTTRPIAVPAVDDRRPQTQWHVARHMFQQNTEVFAFLSCCVC